MDLLISQMESVSLIEPDEYELLLFYFNLNYEDNHIEYYLEQTKNTTSLAWVWMVIIIIAVGVMVWIAAKSIL